MTKQIFPTKIAVVLLEQLLSWQKLNVTAFLASGVANKYPETMGPEFTDATKINYMAIFRQPVMIFSANQNELRNAYNTARERKLDVGIYTELIFSTQGDENLAAIAKYSEADQSLVGIIIYGKSELVNECTKKISLHK